MAIPLRQSGSEVQNLKKSNPREKSVNIHNLRYLTLLNLHLVLTDWRVRIALLTKSVARIIHLNLNYSSMFPILHQPQPFCLLTYTQYHATAVSESLLCWEWFTTTWIISDQWCPSSKHSQHLVLQYVLPPLSFLIIAWKNTWQTLYTHWDFSW